MTEHRGREHHFERLSGALREEIGALLEGELADPRIGLATVSEVQLAPDGRSAQVLIEVEGDDDEARATMQALESAKGYVRHEVGERLGLRRAPELVFRLDRSQQYQARVDELLKRAARQGKRKKEKGKGEDRGPSTRAPSGRPAGRPPSRGSG
jgi:ribosome-binding factor A